MELDCSAGDEGERVGLRRSRSKTLRASVELRGSVGPFRPI